ncbi:MAG: hypothetical protein K9K32_04650 [Halanaerobiales bacterium]|nr:hypothetical protein [Halanaerobiales bacterium]
MGKYEFYKYSLVISVLSIIFIAIYSFKYLWPWSITIFAFQIITIVIANWLLNLIKTKYHNSRYLAPAFILYRRYFAFSLTVYLIMGVFGIVETRFAIIYFNLFIIGFIAIGISTLIRVLVGGKLLDSYNKKDDEE